MAQSQQISLIFLWLSQLITLSFSSPWFGTIIEGSRQNYNYSFNLLDDSVIVSLESNGTLVVDIYSGKNLLDTISIPKIGLESLNGKVRCVECNNCYFNRWSTQILKPENDSDLNLFVYSPLSTFTETFNYSLSIRPLAVNLGLIDIPNIVPPSPIPSSNLIYTSDSITGHFQVECGSLNMHTFDLEITHGSDVSVGTIVASISSSTDSHQQALLFFKWEGPTSPSVYDASTRFSSLGRLSMSMNGPALGIRFWEQGVGKSLQPGRYYVGVALDIWRGLYRNGFYDAIELYGNDRYATTGYCCSAPMNYTLTLELQNDPHGYSLPMTIPFLIFGVPLALLLGILIVLLKRWNVAYSESGSLNQLAYGSPTTNGVISQHLENKLISRDNGEVDIEESFDHDGHSSSTTPATVIRKEIEMINRSASTIHLRVVNLPETNSQLPTPRSERRFQRTDSADSDSSDNTSQHRGTATANSDQNSQQRDPSPQHRDSSPPPHQHRDSSPPPPRQHRDSSPPPPPPVPPQPPHPAEMLRDSTILLRQTIWKDARGVLTHEQDPATFTSMVNLSALFVFVPTFQFVFLQSTLDRESANYCHYNYKCKRDLFFAAYFSIPAVNNAWSNIVYILIGVGFYIYVLMRARYHQFHSSNLTYGLPPCYDVFLSVGAAIAWEAIGSGCFHICPTYWNFQFDTLVMFFIASLLTVQLLAKRQTRLLFRPQSFFLVLAVVVCFNFYGVYFTLEQAGSTVTGHGTSIVWVPIIAGYLIFTFLLIRLFVVAKKERKAAAMSWYSRQYLHLTHQTLLDWGRKKKIFWVAVGGWIIQWIVIILSILYGVSTCLYFLAFMVVNMIIAFCLYTTRKLSLGNEYVKWYVWVLFVVFVIVTIAAIVVFNHPVADNQALMDYSRGLNRDCVFLFYDMHDIWHFLSSIALILFAAIVFHVDDDLNKTPTHLIKLKIWKDF